MEKSNLIINIILIQLLTCVLIILSITLVKFLDAKGYNSFIENYKQKATYDTSVSLVYEGK